MSAKILHMGRVDPNPHWSMVAHAHDFHQLILVMDGLIHVAMRGQTFHAGAGEMLWYPPTVTHEEKSDRDKPCETIYIGFAWDDAPSDWPLCQADTDGRVTQMMQWLIAEEGSHYAGRKGWRNALLVGLLAEYDRLARYKEDPLVVQLRSHIRKNLARPLDLDGLADLAGLSKFHLVRRYRALTGRTPMEDVRHIRLLAAREMLLTTNLPLKEIAPRTGLGDAYRLSRLFRQHFRMTTSALRRR